MISTKDKDLIDFYQTITKLKPEDFVALAQSLFVKLSVINAETGEYAVREADDILNDCAGAFRRMKHKERRIYIKVMNDAIAKYPVEENVDGAPT